MPISESSWFLETAARTSKPRRRGSPMSSTRERRWRPSTKCSRPTARLWTSGSSASAPPTSTLLLVPRSSSCGLTGSRPVREGRCWRRRGGRAGAQSSSSGPEASTSAAWRCRGAPPAADLLQAHPRCRGPRPRIRSVRRGGQQGSSRARPARGMARGGPGRLGLRCGLAGGRRQGERDGGPLCRRRLGPDRPRGRLRTPRGGCACGVRGASSPAAGLARQQSGRERQPRQHRTGRGAGVEALRHGLRSDTLRTSLPSRAPDATWDPEPVGASEPASGASSAPLKPCSI